jgi:hypothetical protein
MSNEKLGQLISEAKKIKVSEFERRAQRKSFVYGNTHIENSRITRQMVDAAEAKLDEQQKPKK